MKGVTNVDFYVRPGAIFGTFCVMEVHESERHLVMSERHLDTPKAWFTEENCGGIPAARAAAYTDAQNRDRAAMAARAEAQV